jgi:carboxyl-terminal processing protease
MFRKTIFPQILLFFLVFSVAAASKPEQRTFRISKNLTIFNSVFRELDLFYVDTLNYDKVIKEGIDQMLEKLDPYTVYMPEEETDDLTFMTTGEYAGIGAMIMKSGTEVCMSEPYEGMPAQRNGIRAGDILVEIDGQKVTGKTVNQVRESNEWPTME